MSEPKARVFLGLGLDIAAWTSLRGTIDREVVRRIDGFVRGMTRQGDYLFVARSRLRKNASTFKDLPIADRARTAGLSVIHLPTGALAAELTYNASVDEIFDVQALPGLRRPGILNTIDETYRLALATPDATYWARTEQDEGGPAGGGG